MKAIKHWKLSIVAISFVLVLGFGLGAQYGFHALNVVRPLEAEFTKIQGVHGFHLNTRHADLVVELEEVHDLKQTFQEISMAATRALGSRMGSLVLKDRRTPELEEVYHSIHASIQEGLATGRFTSMFQDIDTALGSQNLVRHRVSVTTDYIFVQLHNESGYLYEVLPRSENATLSVRVERGESG